VPPVLPILEFRKYPNRRLYDMRESRYITLADIRKAVLEGHEIRVIDHKTGKDMTQEVLLDVLRQCEMEAPRLEPAALTDLIRRGPLAIPDHRLRTEMKAADLTGEILLEYIRAFRERVA
jgi:polyhydroxyalkanoate synthesis repressor PhaR